MKKLLLAALVVIFSMSVNAQKLNVVSGSPEVIKGDKSLGIVFTYDDVLIGKMEETAYMEREIKERNDKEAGSGDSWAVAWKQDQVSRYPARFIELFNKTAGELFDAGIKVDAENPKYTIKVNTSMIEPGFNVGVARKPALTNHEIVIYETANPGNIIHELTILKSPGNAAMGYDFDAGLRIQEAFAKAGKEYGQFLYKKYFK
jgi:hypothetical protein